MNFVVVDRSMSNGLQNLHLLTFTHRELSLEQIGRFHLETEVRQTRLQPLIEKAGWKELMFLSTCNRVALLWVSSENTSTHDISKALSLLYPEWSTAETEAAANTGSYFQGLDAARHLFRVASSLESLVIGEREIITQVRQSYEQALEMGFAGDVLRLLVRGTIKTAKQVFTETAIANRPVSVVNLACHRLRELSSDLNSRIVFVGAGQTIAATARKLKKYGFHRFTFFNRTLSRAEQLATQVGGEAQPLTELINFKAGFDILVACTGSSDAVVNTETYQELLQGDTGKKILIDLAIPYDIEQAILDNFAVQSIQIEDLKEIATNNLEARKSELNACNQIVEVNLEEYEQLVRIRNVERAMQQVPQKVKEIRQTALSEVFSEDIEQLDAQSRATLEKVLSYVEKKYISVPMKMAREIMLDQ